MEIKHRLVGLTKNEFGECKSDMGYSYTRTQENKIRRKT